MRTKQGGACLKHGLVRQYTRTFGQCTRTFASPQHTFVGSTVRTVIQQVAFTKPKFGKRHFNTPFIIAHKLTTCHQLATNVVEELIYSLKNFE